MEYPFVHYINTHTTSEPQRGLAFMPKRGVNSNENEINRIYKVTTKGVVDILQFFVPRKSDLWQADLYPDTRSTVPALTAEEWIEGANAPPKLMQVNPTAAEAKPKIQVAKKANILSQLPNTQEQQPASQPTARAQQPSAASSQQQSRRAVVDDDMGIVRVEKSAPRQERVSRREPSPPEAQPNPMIPKQLVALKSAHGEGTAKTAGQQRAAKELEKIRREQTRTVDPDEIAPPSTVTSRRTSNTSTVCGSVSGEQESPEESLYNDVQRMKQILRQHERRIRLLEEELAEKNMANAYGF